MFVTLLIGVKVNVPVSKSSNFLQEKSHLKRLIKLCFMSWVKLLTMVKLHFFHVLEQYQSFSQMLIYERRVWYLAGLYDIVASFKIRVTEWRIIFKFLCHLHPRINVIFNLIQQFLLSFIVDYYRLGTRPLD